MGPLFGSEFMDFMVYNDIAQRREAEESSSSYYGCDEREKEDDWGSIFDDTEDTDY